MNACCCHGLRHGGGTGPWRRWLLSSLSASGHSVPTVATRCLSSSSPTRRRRVLKVGDGGGRPGDGAASVSVGSTTTMHRKPSSSKATMRPHTRPSFTNATMRTQRQPSSSVATTTTPTTMTLRPLHLAIVGSGPAGFYSARRLLQRFDGTPQSIRMDMYEQLPVPFGLVRFGVAPDHPEVKNCIDTFSEVAASPSFAFRGNVTVGRDLSLRDLADAYDGILFAYGAAADRRLSIPGEEELESIPGGGVYSARAFVGWYNGLPEYAGLQPRLDGGSDGTAVVVGQGNVALDVARVLLSGPDRLRGTDIAEHALDALSRSTIRRVHVVGRRGPMQAAFTIKELRELMTLNGVRFGGVKPGLLPHDLKTLPRPKRRIAELLRKHSGAAVATADAPSADLDGLQKSWALEFMQAPHAFVAGNDNTSDSPPCANRLTAVDFTSTEFTADTIDQFDTDARVKSVCDNSSAQVRRIACGAAFRSIGYRSVALPGMAETLGIAFDARRGIIPNIGGRAITSTGEQVPGVYCTGWVKTGPTGVIATTMEDAFAAAEAVVEDWTASKERGGSTTTAGIPSGSGSGSDSGTGNGGGGGRDGAKGGWEHVRDKLESRQVVGWRDWLRIDAAEVARGKAGGKAREKFATVAEMLEAAA